MNRRRHVVLGVLLSIASLAGAGAGAGCSDNPVGRICDLGSAPPQVSEVVVASPSLDCVSRTCLRFPPTRELPPGSIPPTGNNGLCTDTCNADTDCDRVPESPCVTGFTCGIAVTAGPFCCQKFCICKDYILLPESGQPPTPKACDASIAANECCNLEGRPGNADYPLCH
jgi:hypothetical protein